MANNIDELHFEAILDDAKFIEAINRDKKAAQDLNISLSKLLDIKTKIDTGTAGRKMEQSMRNTADALRDIEAVQRSIIGLQETMVGQAGRIADATKSAAEEEKSALSAKEQTARATERTAEGEKKHEESVRRTNVALSNTRSLMRTISQLTGVYFGAMGIRRFLSSMIEITGQFEVQKMALRTMLRDIDGADRLFEQLYRFSSDSTYRFSELAKHAKQLAGFGIGRENLLETTKMLGDVASGLGVSIDRIILAYGHVKSSGFLRGIQLRSFSQNGVPVLEELAKILSEAEGKAVSLGQVFDKMTKREIPFEMVEQAFKNMTSEGGKFYKMQEVLSKTLAGQINILKGRWENLMYAIGNSQEGVLKGAVSKISNLLVDYEKLGFAIKEAIAVWGAYKVATIAAAVANGTFTASSIALTRSLQALATWISANPWALLAAGVAYATMEVIKFNREARNIKTASGELEKSTKEYEGALKAEIAELDSFYTKLKFVKEGTEDYAAVKNALFTRFNPYIEKLRDEGVAVNDLASLYSRLAIEIQNANKEKFLDEFTQNAKNANKDAVDKINDTYGGLLRDIKASGFNLNLEQQEALWQYIRGTIDGADETIAGMTKLFQTIDKVNVTPRGLVMKESLLDLWAGRGKTFGSQLTELRSQYRAAAEDLSNAMIAAQEVFDKTNGNIKKSGNEVDGWAKKVEDALKGVGDEMKNSLTPKSDEGYFDYIARVGKQYKEISEYRDKALKADKATYNAQLEVVKAVDKALEGNILSDVRVTRTPWKGSDKSESEQKKQIATLKNGISMLEKIREAYQRLEPYLGDETAKALANIFGGSVEEMTLESINGQIMTLVSGLRLLGGEGEEAADIIENRLGVDAVGTLIARLKEEEKVRKALEKYEKTLRDWKSQDFNISGSGFLYDINKILADYNTALGKVDNKYQDAVKEATAAHKGNAEAIAAATKELGELSNAEKEYIRVQAQEKLTGIAKKFFKEATDGLDMRDWGDKTYRQVKSILERLNGAQASGIAKIPKNVKDAIEAAGLSLEDFYKTYNKLFSDARKNVSEELMKKTAQQAKKLVGTFGEVGSSIKDWGDELDSDFLRGLGEAIEKAKELGGIIEDFMNSLKYEKVEPVVNDMANAISGALDDIKDDGAEFVNGEQVDNVVDNLYEAAEAAGDIAENMSDVADDATEAGKEVGKLANTADWITLIIKVILMLVEQVVNAIGRQTQAQIALADAAARYRDALYDANLLMSEGYFGEDSIGRIASAWDNANNAAKKYNSQVSKMRFFVMDRWGNEDLQRRAEKINDWLENDANVKIRDLYDLSALEEFYKNGEFDINKIIAYWEAGWSDRKRVGQLKLGRDAYEYIKELIDLYDQYQEQQKEFANSIKDLFGNLADTIADDMVSAFVETGNALDNLEKSFEDFGENVAKIMVRSILSKKLMDEYEDEILKLGNDYFDALGKMKREEADMFFAEQFADLAARLKLTAEQSADFVNGLLAFFQENKLLPSGADTESGSVGKGIQSITEDTANLLASYINAIRADVSYMRAMQEGGWQDVKAIREAVTLGGTPDYNLYMAQIAANTANTSQHTLEILQELRGVIGGQGSIGNGVRVYMQ